MWNIVVFVLTLQEFQFHKIWSNASRTNYLKITRSPKDYFPKSGNLQLMCDAEGDPTPVIVWYNKMTKSPINEEKSLNLKFYNDGGYLVITNPKEKETYELYCNASNSNQWVISKPVKTGLSFLSNDFVKQPQNILIFKESQTALLSCQLPIGNPNPKSNWFKDQNSLSEKFTSPEDLYRFSIVDSDEDTTIKNCSLKIKNLKVSDTGKYQCIATNDYYRLESQISWLLVVNTLNDKVFNINIKQITKKVGEDVDLICHESHKQNIKWMSSKELSKSDKIYLYKNKMRKRNLKLEDRGIYACETNETNSRLLNIFNLSIISNEPIEEKLKIQKKVVIEGVNVILECDLDKTKAEFYWETPQSQPIFPNEESQQRIRVTKDGFLNINNAQISDSGKYTCNVHSSLDVKFKSILLEVTKHQLDIYPIISLPAQNLTVSAGSDIKLQCEVIGEDIIKIIWYIGINIPEKLLKDWQISFPSKESLLITNVQINRHTNFYTCEAINDQGLKTSWTAFVNVVSNPLDVHVSIMSELPKPPVVESPKNIKSTSLELAWSSDNNPKFKILYWIEYVHFGSKNGWEIYKKNWHLNFITIENLKPDTWYQFLVRSKNDFGIGRASVPTENVKTKKFINDEPYSGELGFQFSKINLMEPEIVNGHQIKLHWVLNKDENENNFKVAFYTQFYLNYKPVSIQKCLIDKFNENPFESNPALNDYCSLRSMTNDKLTMLKYDFRISKDKDFQKPIDFQKMNISVFSQSHLNNYAKVVWLIENLTFFQCYNVSISSKTEYRSVSSNHKLILIPEKKPSRPPDNIHISWMLPDLAINIKWDLPNQKYWNGLLTGSNIYMKSNESDLVLKFNDSQPNKVISHANPNINWLFRVSLQNCAGESEKSPQILLYKLSDALLPKSENLPTSNERQINLFKKSWMIATLVVTSVLIWVMMTFLTIYICCSKSFRFQGSKFIFSKSGESDEIDNNKDFKDELIINPIHNTEKELNFHDKENDDSYNINSLNLSPASSSSFCNPYASTQIFEPMTEARVCDTGTDCVRYNWIEEENMNLYYMSTPIFDSSSSNDIVPGSLNYFLSNTQEWMGQPSLASIQNNGFIPYSQYSSQDDSKTSEIDLHFENKSPRKDQSVELSIIKNNGTMNNPLLSTAPFSDQFTVYSKSKSTNNSSNSDSSHRQHTNDHKTRLKKSNGQTKSSKRRQNSGDCFDQSSEMTHLLVNLQTKRSLFSNGDLSGVYDIPYSDSTSITDKDN